MESNTYFDVSCSKPFFHKLILQEKPGVSTCFLYIWAMLMRNILKTDANFLEKNTGRRNGRQGKLK